MRAFNDIIVVDVIIFSNVLVLIAVKFVAFENGMQC
jgi:hypothetical protein